MRFLRASLFRIFCLITLINYSTVQATEPAIEWSSTEKAVAVHACREAILDSAEQDYLKRHDLRELPADFRQRIAPAIEPYLRTCDCMVDVLSTEISLNTFNAGSTPVQLRIKELVSPKGACAAKTGT